LTKNISSIVQNGQYFNFLSVIFLSSKKRERTMNKRLFAACLSVGMLLAGCSAKKSSTVKDGTYEETVDGRNGKVIISTTISSGKITDVEVKDKETHFETVIDTFICHILENNLPLSTLVDQRIQNLITYDKQYETKYYETLCMYISCQYSKQKTAESLYIHLNTVKYRLQQIEKLFDIDFEKDEKLIRLAMLVHHV
jgi:regulator of polyketide synthase expression